MGDEFYTVKNVYRYTTIFFVAQKQKEMSCVRKTDPPYSIWNKPPFVASACSYTEQRGNDGKMYQSLPIGDKWGWVEVDGGSDAETLVPDDHGTCPVCTYYNPQGTHCELCRAPLFLTSSDDAHGQNVVLLDSDPVVVQESDDDSESSQELFQDDSFVEASQEILLSDDESNDRSDDSIELSERNRRLYEQGISQIQVHTVDRSMSVPSTFGFPAMCGRKYDGHMAIVQTSDDSVFLAEMCSKNGFYKIKGDSKHSNRRESAIYYKLFDVLRFQGKEVGHKKYAERLADGRRLVMNPSLQVTEQRSRHRGAKGNTEYNWMRGFDLYNRLSLMQHHVVQSVKEAWKYANAWAKEKDSEGAILSSMGSISTRYKLKPWYEGEMIVDSITRGGTTRAHNNITSVTGKDIKTNISTTVKSTKLPSTIQKGDTVTFRRHMCESAMHGGEYCKPPTFIRVRNDDINEDNPELLTREQIRAKRLAALDKQDFSKDVSLSNLAPRSTTKRKRNLTRTLWANKQAKARRVGRELAAAASAPVDPPSELKLYGLVYTDDAEFRAPSSWLEVPNPLAGTMFEFITTDEKVRVFRLPSSGAVFKYFKVLDKYTKPLTNDIWNNPTWDADLTNLENQYRTQLRRSAGARYNYDASGQWSKGLLDRGAATILPHQPNTIYIAFKPDSEVKQRAKRQVNVKEIEEYCAVRQSVLRNKLPLDETIYPEGPDFLRKADMVRKTVEMEQMLVKRDVTTAEERARIRERNWETGGTGQKNRDIAVQWMECEHNGTSFKECEFGDKEQANTVRKRVEDISAGACKKEMKRKLRLKSNKPIVPFATMMYLKLPETHPLKQALQGGKRVYMQGQQKYRIQLSTRPMGGYLSGTTFPRLECECNSFRNANSECTKAVRDGETVPFTVPYPLRTCKHLVDAMENPEKLIVEDEPVVLVDPPSVADILRALPASHPAKQDGFFPQRVTGSRGDEYTLQRIVPGMTNYVSGGYKCSCPAYLKGNTNLRNPIIRQTLEGMGVSIPENTKSYSQVDVEKRLCKHFLQVLRARN